MFLCHYVVLGGTSFIPWMLAIHKKRERTVETVGANALGAALGKWEEDGDDVACLLFKRTKLGPCELGMGAWRQPPSPPHPEMPSRRLSHCPKRLPYQPNSASTGVARHQLLARESWTVPSRQPCMLRAKASVLCQPIDAVWIVP